MEIFKFNNVDTPDFLTNGQILNGYKKVTWVERYRDPGEVRIVAPVSSGLRDILPLGSMVSHVDTQEVMMIENHEIDEDVEGTEPDIVITGRSLETWLDQRSVGYDIAADGGVGLFLPDYTVAFDTTWNQIEALINAHINEPLINAGDEVQGFIAEANQEHIGPSVGAATRIVPRGPLHAAVLRFLEIDDFGIQVIRPSPGDDPAITKFSIHNGFDRTESVIFSHVAGDLKKPRYFWSNKYFKTHAYVVSTYNNIRVAGTSETGLDRRLLYVNASDIDSQFDSHPTGTDRDDVLAAMEVRGQDAIAAHRRTSLLSTNIAATTNYKYRVHYKVGDLVTVNGNYDTSSVMRVTEHVEFVDETGESGYPTLSAY